MSMTESEALAELKTFPVNCLDFIENQALGVAISALEEVQQLHAIGTVSEFRELKEKATEKKPIKRTDNDGYVDFYCPNCDAHLFFDDEQKFCNECGQAIVNDFKV